MNTFSDYLLFKKMLKVLRYHKLAVPGFRQSYSTLVCRNTSPLLVT
jgi:hypothetical protein